MKAKLLVIDDFLTDPDKARYQALNDHDQHSGNFPGIRTVKKYVTEEELTKLRQLVGSDSMTPWKDSGKYQFASRVDNVWIHRDSSRVSVFIYLYPNPPLYSGTSLYNYDCTRDKTGLKVVDKNHPDCIIQSRERQAPLFGNSFIKTDSIQNKYNRAVILMANRWHASDGGFGDPLDRSTQRLTKTIFFSRQEVGSTLWL